MNKQTDRYTVYFAPEIHRALRLKAAHRHTSISEIVNEAVTQLLHEDEEDLAGIENRVAEETITYRELLDDLKANGKI